jgi:hypothetical protein
MSDPRKDQTLTDADIQTRRVDDGKPAWETPRLTELGVSGSESGPVAATEGFGDDGSSDATGPS